MFSFPSVELVSSSPRVEKLYFMYVFRRLVYSVDVLCELSLLLILSLASRVFSGFSGFPPSAKIPDSTRTRGPSENYICNDVILVKHSYLFIIIYLNQKT
jgi:hypothetical protein